MSRRLPECCEITPEQDGSPSTIVGLRYVLAILKGILVPIVVAPSAAVALGAGTASGSASNGATPATLTCVRSGTHLIGCLRRKPDQEGSAWYGNPDCNVQIWGYRTTWLFAAEGFRDMGGPDAYAKSNGSGSWRIGNWIGLGQSQSAVIGRVVPRSSDTSVIVDKNGVQRGVATGPDPAAVALLLLAWGTDCFPK